MSAPPNPSGKGGPRIRVSEEEKRNMARFLASRNDVEHLTQAALWADFAKQVRVFFAVLGTKNISYLLYCYRLVSITICECMGTELPDLSTGSVSVGVDR